MKLHGLVAAVHTPFKADGSLNPSSVDAQAKLLASQGIKLAFITGSTGESSSMQLEERKEIYSAWKEASAKHGVEVIAHTGSNSVWDARELASFAQECGFVATSSLAPSYYKPGTVQRLVECCAFAASGAPDLPYYYYDIPVLTGVRFNPVDFIRLAKEQIPNFAGIKFTNPDLALYQTTLNYDETVDIPEKKARGETASTPEARIADFRAKIAERKAATGKDYLSFYYMEASSYEIAE